MCDQDCGLGNQTRMRNCSDPAPMNGGKPCVGDSVDVKHCKIKECAGNTCEWLDMDILEWMNVQQIKQ